MAEPITIYKLTILNMLDKVDFPLTNTQISNFFLEQDYTDYFRVQQVLSDLEDASLILLSVRFLKLSRQSSRCRVNYKIPHTTGHWPDGREF